MTIDAEAVARRIKTNTVRLMYALQNGDRAAALAAVQEIAPAASELQLWIVEGNPLPELS